MTTTASTTSEGISSTQTGIELVGQEWRAFPHTYASHISRDWRDTWLRYGWLAMLGASIAPMLLAGDARIIINAPPRGGKSEFVSYWVPGWFLDLFPWCHVLFASYGDRLSRKYGRRVRELPSRNPEEVRYKVSPTNRDSSEWSTTENGGMLAVSINGTLPGYGGDLVIVDDPIKQWQEAYSPAYKDRLWQTFDTGLMTRLEPGASVIVNMTRWSDDDLCGRLIKEHPGIWTRFKFPALATGDGDILGRAPGEPLCPQRASRERLLQIRSASQYAWDPLYQQEPLPMQVGAAYATFSDGNVDDTLILDPSLPIMLDLDFNIRPGMHGMVGQHLTNRDLLTVVHELHGAGMSVIRPASMLNAPESLCEAFGRLLVQYGGAGKFPGVFVYGDATAIKRSAGSGQSDLMLLTQGLNAIPGLQGRWSMRITRSNPAAIDRIKAVQNALCDIDGARHVKIHPRCERLIHDLMRNVLDATGSDVDKTDPNVTHAGDAFGYRVFRQRPVRSVTKRNGSLLGRRDDARVIIRA